MSSESTLAGGPGRSGRTLPRFARPIVVITLLLGICFASDFLDLLPIPWIVTYTVCFTVVYYEVRRAIRRQ